MFDLTPFQETRERTIAWLRGELAQISTGRANPALLDSVMVDSYGTKQPVKSVATISVEEARTLRVAPWQMDMVRAIENAINDARLPVTVSSDSAGVRVHIPQMTEEGKQKIMKLAKDKLEDARITVRKEREKMIKHIDADGLSVDEKKHAKDLLQKQVETTNQELQDVFDTKYADIMAV